MEDAIRNSVLPTSALWLDAMLNAAAGNNPDPEVITVLVRHGAKIEAGVGIDARTPLMWAAVHNPNPDVVTSLIENGADVNVRCRIGRTALMLASDASMGRNIPEVIITLLENGADVTVMDNYGEMAIDYARHNRHIVDTDAFWQLSARSFLRAELAVSVDSAGLDGKWESRYCDGHNPVLELSEGNFTITSYVFDRYGRTRRHSSRDCPHAVRHCIWRSIGKPNLTFIGVKDVGRTSTVRVYRYVAKGTYNIADGEIRLVFSDGFTGTFPFFRSENTITIGRTMGLISQQVRFARILQ